MSVVLFIFWVILSGKIDAFHLSLGLLSSVGVAYFTHRLELAEPPVYGLRAYTWRGWFSYLPWLCWQIFDSAVQVAKVVLAPEMPIDPGFIRFKCKLPHTVAHLTLANSITLTPGTVTIDLQGDDYIVHALTKPAGEALIPAAGEGDMQRRVFELFQKRGES
ncbi:MAG: Na+/H+ antiporter subunit E [Elusimicrobiota bacterium]